MKKKTLSWVLTIIITGIVTVVNEQIFTLYEIGGNSKFFGAFSSIQFSNKHGSFGIQVFFRLKFKKIEKIFANTDSGRKLVREMIFQSENLFIDNTTGSSVTMSEPMIISPHNPIRKLQIVEDFKGL